MCNSTSDYKCHNSVQLPYILLAYCIPRNEMIIKKHGKCKTWNHQGVINGTKDDLINKTKTDVINGTENN